MNDSAQLFQRLREALPLARPPWTGSGRQAGVLVALTDERRPRVLLGRRALHLPLHPGEIAFPGGKREVGDAGPWDTALREAFEEVACPPGAVCPLGELPPLLTRSGYTIHPCVAIIPASLPLRADPGEVAELLLPRLDRFTDPAGWHVQHMPEPDTGRVSPVPHFRLPRDTVWGTSARALLLLVNLGLQARLDLSTFKENRE
ncbi:CoA pyrophosphatase [Haliea sp.]|uniref:NUDIX hydrolase n=1 Tax=Haliea sp. TaxID=1932666 RepID=UPI00352861C2